MSGRGHLTWCQIEQVADLPDQVAAVTPTAGWERPICIDVVLGARSRRSLPSELPTVDRLSEEGGVGGQAPENSTGWFEVAGRGDGVGGDGHLIAQRLIKGARGVDRGGSGSLIEPLDRLPS
jgi:hypothetical protein